MVATRQALSDSCSCNSEEVSGVAGDTEQFWARTGAGVSECESAVDVFFLRTARVRRHSGVMANVLVTVETPGENQVVEVTYDGQEIIQPPPTLSEHLSRQAAKIDFDAVLEESSGDEEDQDDDGDGEAQKAEDGTDSATRRVKEEDNVLVKAPHWPWESVRNKLREALTEMSVLSDVIAISTKEVGKDLNGQPKRYMVLDGPVQSGAERSDQPQPRPFLTLWTKRKSLDLPANILRMGAEHLKNMIQSDGSNSSKTFRNAQQEFHVELLRLRQNWRLKKVSNTILGDLSYRTAGSTFKQSGVFEVVKADDNESDDKDDESDKKSGALEGSEDEKRLQSVVPKPQKSVLKVNVPSELEDIAFIEVIIQKESEQLLTAKLSNFGSSLGAGASPKDMHWQKKLEAAQNVLFCKELFAQLAREAISLQAPIPHIVVGNQITASLMTDIQLIISLCHSSSSSHKDTLGGASSLSSKGGLASSSVGSGQGPGPGAPAGAPHPHSHVLEHSLHQLLRLQHRRNINPDHTALSSAPLGISKRRRLAGPRAADRQSLIEMATQPTILEQIIQQAQHVVMCMRTMFILDTMAREMKDPLLICHGGTFTSPTRTSVKVTIVTAGYDNILRTQLVIHVREKNLTVICRDRGKVLHFSYEPQELRDFIYCQISQHQVNGVQALAKCMGWSVLSSSNSLGCGPVEPMANVTGCLLTSPTGDRFVAVRCTPLPPASVFVSSSKRNKGEEVKRDDDILDRYKWDNLPDTFEEVRLEKLDGKNLLGKLELLMACLSPPIKSMTGANNAAQMHRFLSSRKRSSESSHLELQWQ